MPYSPSGDGILVETDTPPSDAVSNPETLDLAVEATSNSSASRLVDEKV